MYHSDCQDDFQIKDDFQDFQSWSQWQKSHFLHNILNEASEILSFLYYDCKALFKFRIDVP